MDAVAFLGLGLLGLPAAWRLCRAGKYILYVWNRTPEKAQLMRPLGMQVCETAAEAVQHGDFVILMLADAQAIEEVLFGQVGAEALAGKTVIQMGTIGPDESREFQRRLPGARYIEAPVMGSVPQADAGELVVMVGCEPEELDHVRPLLEILGPVYRIGPVGAAATMKLALNHLIAAHVTAFSASLALVRQARLDVDLFMEILKRTNLYAPMFDKKLTLMKARRYDRPHFQTKHLLKDARLFRTAASAAGTRTTTVDAIVSVLEEAVAQGFQDLDYASVFEVVARGPTTR